jgi:hypothetical protein
VVKINSLGNLNLFYYICGMKKILLLLLISFTFGEVVAKKQPTLILEVHYTSDIDAYNLSKFKNDTNFCCIFDVRVTKTKDTGYIKIIHKSTGVLLGTFHGVPTKEFIMYVYRNHLTPEYIDILVPKLIVYENKRK